MEAIAYKPFRKGEKYYVSYYDTETKKRRQLSLRTEDKNQAQERVNMINLKANIRNVEQLNFALNIFQDEFSKTISYTPQKSLAKSFSGDFLRYQRTVKDNSNSRLEFYKYLLNDIKAFNLQWEDCENLSVFIDFQEEMKARYSYSSTVKRMKSFMSFINWAKRNMLISDKGYNIVFHNIIREENTNRTREIVLLDKTDFNTILEHCFENDKDMFWFLTLRYLLNSRIEELAKLPIANISMLSDTAFILQRKVKMGKQMYLPSSFMRDLRDYVLERKALGKVYLFEGSSKNRNYYSDKYKELLLALGLNTKYKLTEIRHFTATLIDELFDRKTASIYLGHKQDNDCTSRYIHSDKPLKLRVANALCLQIPYLKKYYMGV